MQEQETAAVSQRERKRAKVKRWLKLLSMCSLMLLICISLSGAARAESLDVTINTTGEGGTMDSLRLLFIFALLALAPSILIMMTSFTRIIIVFSFLRNALGLQQTPPNQVLIGLALFLTFFIMHPVFTEMNETAIKPFSDGEIQQEEAIEKVQLPLKEFMLKQTKTADLNLFLSMQGEESQLEEINPDALLGLGLEVIVPAFVTSELKRAFVIGFLLFLPFMVIDMIVASTLMSMGMVMLPPSMISLPFKLMLFIVVDGWSLIMEMLVSSFY